MVRGGWDGILDPSGHPMGWWVTVGDGRSNTVLLTCWVLYKNFL